MCPKGCIPSALIHSFEADDTTSIPNRAATASNKRARKGSFSSTLNTFNIIKENSCLCGQEIFCFWMPRPNDEASYCLQKKNSTHHMQPSFGIRTKLLYLLDHVPLFPFAYHVPFNTLQFKIYHLQLVSVGLAILSSISSLQTG